MKKHQAFAAAALALANLFSATGEAGVPLTQAPVPQATPAKIFQHVPLTADTKDGHRISLTVNIARRNQAAEDALQAAFVKVAAKSTLVEVCGKKVEIPTDDVAKIAADTHMAPEDLSVAGDVALDRAPGEGDYCLTVDAKNSRSSIQPTLPLTVM